MYWAQDEARIHSSGGRNGLSRQVGRLPSQLTVAVAISNTIHGGEEDQEEEELHVALVTPHISGSSGSVKVTTHDVWYLRENLGVKIPAHCYWCCNQSKLHPRTCFLEKGKPHNGV